MSMAERDGHIWYDGKLVPWRDATTHVLTHSLHYGLAVFEGLRAYKTGEGPAIFRLVEHTAELGGQLGNISSFGVDADAELYLVSYSRGTILRVFGPPSAPSTPGGLRIIRP